MKQMKPGLILLFLLMAVALSACSGGAGLTTSWPGVTVDAERGQAYIANGQHVYAVNLASGVEKWRFPVQAQTPPGFYAAPVLTPDGQLILGNYNKTLYSINPDTGVENQGNWPFLQGKNRFIASPMADDSGVYAPISDGTLVALDLTGKFRWSFLTERSLWSTPLTDGKNVYQPSMDHRVYAIDRDTGQEIWKTDDLGGAIVGKPALGDGVLYLGTFGSEMLAIETNTGEVKWRAAVSDWVWGGPTLAGDFVYFGDLDGYFYALDAATGNVHWKINGDGKNNDTNITEPPLILDGTIYYTSKNGTLYAVDADNGNPLWNQPVGGNLYGSPHDAGDSILVASVGAEALVYAVAPNGAIKWTFTPAK